MDIGGKCIKYGITSNIEGRLQGLISSSGIDINVIRSWSFDLGRAARDIERLIRIKFGCKYLDPSLLPDGWTETLDSSLLPEVISFVEAAIKSPA